MTSRPPRIIRRLYAVIVALTPHTVWNRFGPDQLQLFDDVWQEAPSGRVARCRWTLALFWGAIVAACGAHRDRWSRPLPHATAGGPVSSARGGLPIADLRQAFRGLLRAPWFTLGAVLTFAIGIGLNLAVFALVDRVLFRPLPFRDPHRLVAVFPCNAENGQCYSNMPKAIAVAARQRDDLFEDIAFVGLGDAHSLAGSDALPLNLANASANVLDVLGVGPIVGRDFSSDDVSARRVVALLSHDVWRDRFGSDVKALGRVVTAPAAPKQAIEIVGVLPAGFVVPSVNGVLGADGLVLDLESLDIVESPRALVPGVFARLQPDVDVRRVQQHMNALIAGLQADTPAGNRSSVRVTPLRQGVFTRSHTAFALLFAGASLIWLLAATNLSTLILARSRSQDVALAVRRALGATQWQLLWTSLSETLLVCAAGAIAALLALHWCLAVLAARVPIVVQTAVLTDIDGRMVAVALLGVVGGALLAGVVPARRAWRLDPLDVLKRGTRSGQRTGPAARRFLAVEAAMGTVLVCAAVLSVQSLIGLLKTDLGFRPVGLYAAFGIPAERPATPVSAEVRFAVTRQHVSALRALAGVTSASAVSHALFRPEAPAAVSDADGRRMVVRRVLDDYFEVMDTPVLAGREFSADDVTGGGLVAIMSAGAVNTMWPGVSPQQALGQTVRFDREPPRVLIGVVADTRKEMTGQSAPEVFMPARSTDRLMTIFRTQTPAGVDALTLKRAFEGASGRLSNVAVTSAARTLDPVLQEPRTYAEIFGSFALVALLLGAVGLFAIASGEVSGRTYELGVRLTLGATRAQVERLVLAQAVRPVAIGVAIGLVLAWWAAQSMQAILHDVHARSPMTFVTIAGILLITALSAAWWPARRAGRTDPACVLRTQ